MLRFLVLSVLSIMASMSLGSFLGNSGGDDDRKVANPVAGRPTRLGPTPIMALNDSVTGRSSGPGLAPPRSGPYSTLIRMPDGSTKIHVVLSLPDCGREPDIAVHPEAIALSSEAPPEPWAPWYLLAAPQGGCGPPFTTCGTAVLTQTCPWFLPPSSPAVACPSYFYSNPTITGWLPFVTAPYAFNVLPPNPPLNPNTIATNPLHPAMGVARHWPTASIPISVRIHVPVSQANAPTSNIFVGIPGSQPYYWSDFVNDIVATFTKYQSVPTASVSVSLTVIYNSLPPWYTATFPTVIGAPLGGSSPVAQVGGVLVWDNRASAGTISGFSGPTGDGFNDVTFLTNNHLGGTGGLCSMLVDPASGAISEADVLIDLASFYGQQFGVGGLLPVSGQPWNPRETTAYAHEIGHFFGLDHTNLHVGNTGIGQTNLTCPGQTANPTAQFPFPPSLAVCYTPDTSPPSARHSAVVLSEYPAMTGSIVTSGFSNHVAAPLHTDDAVGISMLYPMTNVATCPFTYVGVPLINASATIRGHVVDASGRAVYGANVFPVLHTQAAATLLPGRPPTGTVSGFFRLSASEVIGLKDPSSGMVCSGSFDCEGIVPVGAGFGTIGSRYDVVVEAVESVGISVGPPASTFTFSEWVEDNVLNPAGVNTWTSSAIGTGVITNGGNGPIGSIELVPGSVVDINVLHNGTVAVELATRPLVQIAPRNCRPAAGSTVTVTVDSNFALFAPSIALLVNGTPVAGLAAYHVPPNPGAYPAGTNTWNVPVAALGLPAGLARLHFTATEKRVSAIAFLPGVNEVVY